MYEDHRKLDSPGDGDGTVGARGSTLGRKAELMSPMPTKKSSFEEKKAGKRRVMTQ